MKKAVIVFSLLALIACGSASDSDENGPKANFTIVSVEKTTTSYHRPALMITVKNTGEATGYNVSCDANALNAAGTIIDTAQAFFAGLGDIAVGQSAQDEAVFFKLSSHVDYTSITYNCSWLTRN